MNYKVEIPLDILNLDEDGYHIFMEGHINEIPVRLLLDTGASKTVINSHFAATHFEQKDFEQNPKGATGISGNEIPSQIAKIDIIHIDQFKIKNLRTSLMPFDHVNQTYAKLSLPPIDAIIGMDILMKGEARILIDTGILEMKMDTPPHPNYYYGQITQ